ncbi:MAG: F0F1 ATP synthase subunit B [Muribaculaceae bacterium]|nr:F0F1 ATP synthase subunit B [Muribaculaceae bacterium]
MQLFTPEFGLAFWMFVAFLGLYFILAKWGWPAIIKMMEDRADLIDKGVALSREAQAQLDGAKADRDKLIAEARVEQAEILREAAKMRNQIVEDAKAQATEEAQKVAEQAQLRIEQTRKEYEHQMRLEVTEVALQIAEKVLRHQMENDKAQQALVEKYLAEAENKN